MCEEAFKWTFKRKETHYLACNVFFLMIFFFALRGSQLFIIIRRHFSLLQTINGINFGSCQNICGALSFLLDNIYIRFL